MLFRILLPMSVLSMSTTLRAQPLTFEEGGRTYSGIVTTEHVFVLPATIEAELSRWDGKPAPDCPTIKARLEGMRANLNFCSQSIGGCSAAVRQLLQRAVNSIRFGVEAPAADFSGLEEDATQYWRPNILPIAVDEVALSLQAAALPGAAGKEVIVALQPRRGGAFTQTAAIGSPTSLTALIAKLPGLVPASGMVFANQQNLMTHDRALACDLLSGETHLSFESDIVAEVSRSLPLSSGQLWRIYEFLKAHPLPAEPALAGAAAGYRIAMAIQELGDSLAPLDDETFGVIFRGNYRTAPVGIPGALVLREFASPQGLEASGFFTTHDQGGTSALWTARVASTQ